MPLSCPPTLHRVRRINTHTFALRREDMELATSCLDSAKRAAERRDATTERELAYVSAYDAWLSGDLPGAAGAFESVVKAHPCDVFALKRAQLLYFFQGNQTAMLAVAQLPAVAEALAGKAFYHGMLGFALEQVGRLDEAEKEGLRGTELCRADSWSHHAVAHATYFKGDLARGLAFLTEPSLTREWDACCSFMLTHNWWHVALFHLDMGNLDRVAEVFDTNVWGVDKNSAEDQLGALGMLLKWELRLRQLQRAAGDGSGGGDTTATLFGASPDAGKGGDVAGIEARRRDVVLHAKAKVASHPYGLYDFLLAHALAATGETEALVTLLESLRAMTEGMPAARREAVAPTWVGVCEAAAAFARGEYAAAADGIKAVIATEAVLGGSTEQRAVVTETLMEALLMSGRGGEAADIVAKVARPFVPAMLVIESLASSAAGDAAGAREKLDAAQRAFDGFTGVTTAA